MKYIQKIIYSKSQIKNILTHRDPFLFLDEINELGEDYIIGTKHVNEDEYYFKGLSRRTSHAWCSST